jgi:hypothetical protein
VRQRLWRASAVDAVHAPLKLMIVSCAWIVLIGGISVLAYEGLRFINATAGIGPFLLDRLWYLFLFVTVIMLGVSQLAMSHVSWRILTLILLGFALFGSVVVQELYQSSRTWNNPVIYGARALIEEGTEIAGMLILIFVAGTNTRVLLNKHRPDALIAAARGRIRLIVAAGVLIPILTGATFILPYPGGPADWLAACIYLLCAVSVFRPVLIGDEVLNQRTALLLLFYLVASAMSIGLKLSWEPEISGVPVSIRGIGVAGLLLTANIVFQTAGRRTTIWFYPAAAVVLLASLWSSSQLLWCTIPSCVALWIFTRESRQNTV